jgi:hypothetical protein
MLGPDTHPARSRTAANAMIALTTFRVGFIVSSVRSLRSFEKVPFDRGEISKRREASDAKAIE